MRSGRRPLNRAAYFAEWDAPQRRSFTEFGQLRNPLYAKVDAERYAVLERPLWRHLDYLNTGPRTPTLARRR